MHSITLKSHSTQLMLKLATCRVTQQATQDTKVCTTSQTNSHPLWDSCPHPREKPWSGNFSGWVLQLYCHWSTGAIVVKCLSWHHQCPDGSWAHDPLAMSGKRHPLSHTKIPLKYETNWIVWISEKQTLNSWKGSVLLPDWCMSYDNSQSRWIHQFVVAQICRGYYQFALLLRLYFLMLVYKWILFHSYPPCNATKKAGMLY
mgnify:CR=1 FL=1